MVNYHQFKEDNPELFENVYPLDLRRIGDTNVMAVPPYRDQNGRRLLLYRIGKFQFKFCQIPRLALDLCKIYMYIKSLYYLRLLQKKILLCEVIV